MARTKKGDAEQASQEQEQEQPSNGLLNLREAANYLGVTPQRIRTILRDGRVESTKNEQGHWRVSTEQLDLYNATKGRRTGGAKSYVCRLAPEQHKALAEFIASQGWDAEKVGLKPRYNYDPDKAKAYRQKRAQKQAEEAEAEAES
jgi:excisionase family DNA binding protein